MGAQLSTMLSSTAINHTSSAFDPHSQVDALISRAASMQKDIEDAAERCGSLEMLLATLHSESEMLLRTDADPAMDALLVLIHRIEALHQRMQDQKMIALTSHRNPTLAFAVIQAHEPLVNACKSQSRVVFGHFRSLSEKARNLTQQFSELATDFTFQIAMAQERLGELQDMLQIAGTVQDGIERQRESWQGQRAAAEIHIQQTRETIRSAERKRDSMESARVVRNILTLGLGEVFDLFDLNEEIKDAERLVASAQQNAHACEQCIQQSISALQRIGDEIACLGALGDAANAQEATLRASVTHGQALRTRTIDLTNASLDISLAVGTLAARSETLSVHYTAQEFAQSVLNFGRLMVSDERLSSLLDGRDPGALQETLDIIAQSDNDNSIWEGGQSLETQRPWIAIEDMM